MQQLEYRLQYNNGFFSSTAYDYFRVVKNNETA